MYETFKRYSRDGLLTIHIGSMIITLIGDRKYVKEAFVQDEANHRHPILLDIFKKAFYKPNDHIPWVEAGGGILMGAGPGWYEQRKFLVQTLKEFGVGNQDIESLINVEVDEFCKYMENELVPELPAQNDSDDSENFFHIPVINILWQIVAGERYDYYDTQVGKIAKKVTDITRVPLYQANLATFFPIVEKIYPKIVLPSNYAAVFEIRKYVEVLIQKHQETFDPENIRDFIDKYLLKMQQSEERIGSTFRGSVGYANLTAMLIDIFLAGMDTTSVTLQFVILYMVNNQEVQKKARHEIHDVIGQNRGPSLADR